ncbi:hypothetical protein OIU85_004092 [Salix viminalis]|uniref:PGG domain-containing protein n=1 Tax=Salix viminalis TaxID=40686 RepID=A0A9Q0SX50_SALVM|nr:hypothetical protein OIU85_004092 [Salix viminalis]
MDEDGNTPLHLAADYGLPMASFLLVRDNRVGRFIVNNRNWTPYDLAEQISKSAVDQFHTSNEMDGSDNSKDVEDGMKNSTAENSTDWTGTSDRKDKAKRATEKASPKDEGLISFIGVMTTLSILYFYAPPKKSRRDCFTVSTLRHISHGKEESKNRIGNLLVVAVLVAGVTFAGAVQLPQLRDYSNSRKYHHESNSTIIPSHCKSYENHLFGYLFLDVGALSSSIVAALILLSASFMTDARYILPAVWLAGFMVFWAIIMMFGAFFLSVKIALIGSHEEWLLIAITVTVVFFLVQAFLFLPWFLPPSVSRSFKLIVLNNLYFLSFFMLFYSWWWLTEKLPELPDLKKKLKHPQ